MFSKGILEYSNSIYLREVLPYANCDKDSIERLFAAVAKLSDVKQTLVEQTGNNQLLAHPVSGGLGAICISAVERHVTPILTDHGFDTSIHLRRYDFRISDKEDVPRAHCYNTISIGGREIVVDIDADPFAKRNLGVVVAPLNENIQLYNEGSLLHSRLTDCHGIVKNFSFWTMDSDAAQPVFHGDSCREISLVNYFMPPEDALCPIYLQSGALLLYGLSRYSIGGGPIINRQHCVLACRQHKDADKASFEFNIVDARSIRVGRYTNGNDFIELSFKNSRKLTCEFSAADGTILGGESLTTDLNLSLRPTVAHFDISENTQLSNVFKEEV